VSDKSSFDYKEKYLSVEESLLISIISPFYESHRYTVPFRLGAMTVSNDLDMDYHNSPYLAENYDLQESFPGASRDVEVFWERISNIRKLKTAEKQPDSVTVLDLGCGTGRILEGLDSLATKSPGSLPNGTFLGIDQVRHMLDRAEQKQSALTQFRKVAWLQGSATDLPKVLVASEGQGAKLDLLTIAISTISLFTELGEAETVLSHVASVIRPHTGRACISILFMDNWSLWPCEEDEASNKPKDYHSKIYPDTIYRNTIVDYQEEGNVNSTKCEVQVITRLPGGEEKVIQIHDTMLKLRSWTEKEFLSAIEVAGLEVVDKDCNGMDTIFTLKRI
jgi:ubiquinone/menaquinone biosynthesis C-methylase UbiE